jgi:hypothetical protein
VFALLASANESFVNFDMSSGSADHAVTVNIGHVRANKTRHAPRGFVGHAQLAL